MKSVFAEELEQADIKQIYKKNQKTGQENHKYVSILKSGSHV